jgi:hypothetical protein
VSIPPLRQVRNQWRTIDSVPMRVSAQAGDPWLRKTHRSRATRDPGNALYSSSVSDGQAEALITARSTICKCRYFRRCQHPEHTPNASVRRRDPDQPSQPGAFSGLGAAHPLDEPGSITIASRSNTWPGIADERWPTVVNANSVDENLAGIITTLADNNARSYSRRDDPRGGRSLVKAIIATVQESRRAMA